MLVKCMLDMCISGLLHGNEIFRQKASLSSSVIKALVLRAVKHIASVEAGV